MTVRRLTPNDDGALRLAVFEKGSVIQAFHELVDLADGVENLREINAVILHKLW